MSESSEQPVDPADESSRLMIDKTLLINALQKLIEEYPSPTIPRSVVRQTLMKVVGSAEFSDLSGHPALQKLDQMLNKAKTEYL